MLLWNHASVVVNRELSRPRGREPYHGVLMYRIGAKCDERRGLDVGKGKYTDSCAEEPNKSRICTHIHKTGLYLQTPARQMALAALELLVRYLAGLPPKLNLNATRPFTSQKPHMSHEVLSLPKVLPAKLNSVAPTYNLRNHRTELYLRSISLEQYNKP